MKKLPLGTTGVDVSAFCLGAIWFGTRFGEEQSNLLLDQYIDTGGTFLDSANIYAHWQLGGEGGDSERFLGQWMKARGNRNKLFLTSKVGFPYPGVEAGLSAGQIEEECNKSLKRLGVDTIDLYYAHTDDRNTPLEETMEAFNKLVTAGKVRFLGASNYTAWRLADAAAICRENGWAGYCGVQQRFTYIRPKPGADFGGQLSANDDLLDYCASSGTTLLAYSPLLSGLYSRLNTDAFGDISYSYNPEQYSGPDMDARLATLVAVADELDATPNQVILAWMIQSDPSVIPLVGASKLSQMEENLGALSLELSTEQMERLNSAGA